jgi:hypothetical protein
MISHFSCRRPVVRRGLILSTGPAFALCEEHIPARFLVIFAE